MKRPQAAQRLGRKTKAVLVSMVLDLCEEQDRLVAELSSHKCNPLPDRVTYISDEDLAGYQRDCLELERARMQNLQLVQIIDNMTYIDRNTRGAQQ